MSEIKLYHLSDAQVLYIKTVLKNAELTMLYDTRLDKQGRTKIVEQSAQLRMQMAEPFTTFIPPSTGDA